LHGDKWIGPYELLWYIPKEIYWFIKKRLRRRKQGRIIITAKLLHETEKAYRLQWGDKEDWIPKQAAIESHRRGKIIVLDVEEKIWRERFGD